MSYEHITHIVCLMPVFAFWLYAFNVLDLFGTITTTTDILYRNNIFGNLSK